MGAVARALREAIDLGLLLWRAQLRMFLNQTIRSRTPGRLALSVVGLMAILLAWGWETIVMLLIVAASHRISVRVDLMSLLSLAFLGYTAILVFTSLVFSLNALLLNPDLDLLLVAPRPVESVLGARMVVQVIRLMLLGLLFTGPALVVLAVAAHDPLLPVGFALLYLLYPVYIVVIVSLLSLLLVRVIPAGRGREILAIFGVLLALAINLVNFLVNPAFRGPAIGPRPRFLRPSALNLPNVSSPWFPPGWAGRAGAAVLNGEWTTAIAWIAVLLVLSVVIFSIGSLLSGRLYLAGWIQAVRPRRRRLRTPAAVASRAGGRLEFLGPVEGAVIVKDWRLRTRDVAQLVRVAMPAVFLVLIFALRFGELPGSVERLGQGPLAAMLGLLPAWILLFSLGLTLGLSAVSLEGKAIWIYAASPNSILDLIQAKCWSTALPITVVTAVVAIGSEAVIRPGWPAAAAAVMIVIALSAAVSAVMVGIGAVFARFDWTDARRMVNPAGAFIAMGVYAALSLVTVVLFGIALAVASVSGLPLITTWLAAMLVALGAAFAAAALALLFGNERLRGLELG